MKRRTFLSALAAVATPLTVSACNDGSLAAPNATPQPAASYGQSAQWAPVTAGDVQFTLTRGGHELVAVTTSGRPDWSYGRSFDELNGATGLVWHSGSLVVVDSGNRRLVRLSPTGQPLGVWTDTRFERLHTALSHEGALYVTDTLAHCVWRIDGTGNAQRLFGELGGAEGELNGPRGIALTADHQLVIVDAGNRRIVLHDVNGAFVREWGASGFVSPRHVIVDRTGAIHVSDAVVGKVWTFSEDGRRLGEHVPSHAESTTPTIDGLAIDAGGDVVVTLRS